MSVCFREHKKMDPGGPSLSSIFLNTNHIDHITHSVFASADNLSSVKAIVTFEVDTPEIERLERGKFLRSNHGEDFPGVLGGNAALNSKTFLEFA